MRWAEMTLKWIIFLKRHAAEWFIHLFRNHFPLITLPRDYTLYLFVSIFNAVKDLRNEIASALEQLFPHQPLFYLSSGRRIVGKRSKSFTPPREIFPRKRRRDNPVRCVAEKPRGTDSSATADRDSYGESSNVSAVTDPAAFSENESGYRDTQIILCSVAETAESRFCYAACNARSRSDLFLSAFVSVSILSCDWFVTYCVHLFCAT